MGGKAYGHSDSHAGGASVQNFSDSSGKPRLAVHNSSARQNPIPQRMGVPFYTAKVATIRRKLRQHLLYGGEQIRRPSPVV
jgi:hypothetical protein